MKFTAYFFSAMTAASVAVGSAIPDSKTNVVGGPGMEAKRSPVDITVDVCKALGGEECIRLQLGPGTCNNLQSHDGRPFVSGSVPLDLCTVYSEAGCPYFSGQSKDLNSYPTDFGFNGASVECAIKG